MSYPYQYSSPGQPGAPYVPPPQPQNGYTQNGYAPNGYQMQNPASQIPMQYVNPQQVQNQPMVVIPQRTSQQYNQYQPPYPSQHHAPTVDSIKVQPRNNVVPQQRSQPQHTPRHHQQAPHRPQQPYTPSQQQPLHRQQDIPKRQQDTPQRVQQVPQGRQQVPLQQYQQTPRSQQQQAARPQQYTPRPQQEIPRIQQQTPRNQQQTPRSQQQTPRLQQQTPRSQQQTTQPQQEVRHPQVVIKTPARSLSASTAPRPSPKPSGQDQADYDPLLLLLAEEYIAAAHALGPVVALAHRPADQQTYYKLMSTGMGCMEAVLKKYHLLPSMEGQLRLRYATLLHDETENNTEAENVLSHGIMLCQRHRLLDLKYSMQHLQARVLAKSKPKAAIKSLVTVIKEAEDYRHIPWVYALRFLCVSLCQQIHSQPETSTALHHLEAISALSEQQGDTSIYVVSATFKALLHSRTPGSDSTTEVQRAIADARQYQLDRSVKELAQIMTLINVLDLVCSIQNHSRDHVIDKMNAMHHLMDREHASEDNTDEGLLGVPIDRSSSGYLYTSTGGIFRQAADGRDQLVFSWVHRRDLYCLGYYLSGVATSMHNEKKSDYFLNEGIKLIRGIYLPKHCQHLPITDHILESLQQYKSHPESISGMWRLTSWRTLIDWHSRLQLAFHACSRADWPSARTYLTSLQQTASDLSLGNGTHRERLVIYLSGMIDQSEGHLDSALMAYRSPYLALPNRTVANDPEADIAILAALNSLLIIHEPSHPQHTQFDHVLTQLEPLCNAHRSKDIISAFLLIKGSAETGRNVNATNWIKTALNLAKSTQNNHLVALSLNTFTNRFASDSLDGQAMKAHEAGLKVAIRAKSVLWECTAEGMLASLLEKQGKEQEAVAVREKIEGLRKTLPEDLRG